MKKDAVMHETAPLPPESAAFDWHGMLADPKFWVMAAFVIFFALFGRKLWAALTRGLDERSARIGAELSEARKLREEAQRVLEGYRKLHAESLKEAEAILVKAREDSAHMAAATQAQLKELLATRTRMAESKIQQAEQQAVNEVRDHVIDITIAAAKAIIVENIQQMPGDELIKHALADLERKVH